VVSPIGFFVAIVIVVCNFHRGTIWLNELVGAGWSVRGRVCRAGEVRLGISGRVGVSRPVDGFDSSSLAGLAAFKLAFLLKIPHQTPDFHLLALHKTNKPSTKSPKRALPLVPAHRFMICFVDFMEINCSIVPSASLFQADRLMNCRSCSSKLRTFMPGEGEKLTFH
jgi:hypothetical protein